jgi:ABC-2 type transport system ATP-binding protein
MRASIHIDTLTKTYPGANTPALDKLSLEVHPGEVYGFLGSNGAGKSTTIRLLLNFIQPTNGSATIMGNDIVKESVAVKRHVGYLSGDVALWPKVTGNDIFAYLGSLQQNIDRTYLQDLIHRFEATPNIRIDELSKGNRQKIGIIQALMHKPDVLILDEPTSGLDPLMQEVFYATIREASARGAAVFLSSHNLSEAQNICDRVGIIKHGKLIHEQTVKTNGTLSNPIFHITMKDAKQITRLKAQGVMTVINTDSLTASVRPKGSIAQALKELSTYNIARFSTQEPNLEDDFLEYYAETESPQEPAK